MAGSEPLVLDEDRYFDSDPAIRKVARELYESVKALPIVSPHGHVDPALFAENRPFPDPAELILIPDHYIFRMLYSQGIPLERLGIPAIDGTPVETDRRKIWQLFADQFHLFAGTPTGAWLNHTFAEVFGIEEKLGSASAMRIYDRLAEQLQSAEFLPRALYERFNIEALSTTDAATDGLGHHQAIRDSGWEARIIPCFRPDGVVNILTADWKKNIDELGRLTGMEINSFPAYIEAIEDRRRFFQSMGAVSTDHAALIPYTDDLLITEREMLFQKALLGTATSDDAALFTGHMLMEMARMSCEDGLVMQLHPGSYRDHNKMISERFGPDKGCDIPLQTEYTQHLHAMLNKYGNEPGFRLIVFTLDESAYSRELAPLAGHYPAMKLGPPWWFHDSIEGMTRYREHVTETAGIYNTAGFNDDTRALPSIPARHDLCRRVDANFLARLVSRYIIDKNDALKMIHALSYDLVKNAYNLD